MAVMWLAAAACLPACDSDGDLPGDDAGLADGGVDADCAYFCDSEDQCGLRSYDECVAASCLGGIWFDEAETDGCFESAANCADAALCPCQARCDKEDECFGSPDPECVADCTTLTEQAPVATYAENRCILESACEDLALCSGG